MSVHIRLMREQDIPAVFRVQTQAYVSAMVEAESIFRKRLAAAPATCWVAEDASAGVCAYLMAYPSTSGKISSLGSDFHPATEADSLYLHDLAVGTAMHGRGVGVQLVRHAEAYATSAGWTTLHLVSVQSTKAFWQKQGFVEVTALSPEQTSALMTYSGPAYYCVKQL
ncbi:GNAT family N-acetyltransferase [Undibacterium sp. WLX3042]|uniref:GNAT family N-acetyltransferase n=1 Tax=Undibacterium sp. WLX3042 TaxID=3412686 RepID=UPI003C2C979A